MNAIEVYNISKKYVLHHEKPTLLKDLFLRPFRRHETTEEFWALKDISFEVVKGETVGIIGENGAGKSTLLKILTGVTKPTTGTIKANGRIGALLELGAGFHPDLTGRENVYLNGAILGLNSREIDAKFNSIVEFAGISNFIDIPVKTYSSGMVVRLGFAVAVHMEPDILITDEVLAVGDEEFQARCIEKIEQFRRQNKTIVFVTHDTQMVLRICNRAILVVNGGIRSMGVPEEIVNNYRDYLNKKYKEKLQKTISTMSLKGERFGTREAEIASVKLLNAEEESSNFVISGENSTIVIDVIVNNYLSNPILGFHIRGSDGICVYDTNTMWRKMNTGEFYQGDKFRVEYKQKMILIPGTYYLTVAIGKEDGISFYDWMTNILTFEVLGDNYSKGHANLSSDIYIERMTVEGNPQR